MIEIDKNTTPLVSICIPMYNVAEYIEETLKQALNQSYDNIEIIIVDDNSTDNSYEIASRFKSDKVRLFKNLNKGGNAARNYAFKKSKGVFIKFLDADDYCSYDMIMKQVNRILRDGSVDTLIHSPLKMVYPDGSFVLPPRLIDKDYEPGIELLVDIWKREGFNIPHCHLMHRNLVEKSGGWDEQLIKNQDGEFFARVASLADKSLSVNDVYAFWRQTNKGVSSKKSINAHSAVINSYDIIAQLLLKYNSNLQMRKICGKYIGFFVFENYLELKDLFPMIDDVLEKNNCSLELPNKKVVRLFSIFFGWKKSLRYLHKFKML